MKYVYFYSTENPDFENNYAFGRFSIKDTVPIACAYSDDLTSWDDQTPPSSKVTPPLGWRLPYKTIDEFLSAPTTYAVETIKAFKLKYPELFI